MKKLVALVFVIFLALALVAGSMAAPGKAWASALEKGFFHSGSVRLHLPLLMKSSMGTEIPPILQPVDCGLRPTVKNLVTSQGVVTGEVRVHHDAQYMYVEIEAAEGQCLAGIQLQVATELAGIPQVNGIPTPALFEHVVTFSECVTKYTFTLPMQAEWTNADSLVLAVHVDTTQQQTGANLSAWGDCTAFPGDATAKYCTYQRAQTKVIPYNVSVGYEDLAMTHPTMDFDYNDWITDIAGNLRYCRTADHGTILWQLDLTVTPQARGAGLDHAYHIDFPANIFPSNGTATFILSDQNGNVIGAPQELPFIANQINQFDLIDPTSSALPGTIVNADESKLHQETLRIAALRIEFEDPFLFDVNPYLPALEGNEHGERLFFQPHLSVYSNPVHEVRPGDVRMLVVPFLVWHWPEERVNIWRAYPDVIPGDVSTNPKTPPQFPTNWYDNFNNCVYNGVPCSPVLGTVSNIPVTPEP